MAGIRSDKRMGRRGAEKGKKLSSVRMREGAEKVTAAVMPSETCL